MGIPTSGFFYLNISQIQALRASGLSWLAISRKMGIARATCQRALNLVKPGRNVRKTNFPDAFLAPFLGPRLVTPHASRSFH